MGVGQLLVKTCVAGSNRSGRGRAIRAFNAVFSGYGTKLRAMPTRKGLPSRHPQSFGRSVL